MLQKNICAVVKKATRYVIHPFHTVNITKSVQFNLQKQEHVWQSQPSEELWRIIPGAQKNLIANLMIK